MFGLTGTYLYIIGRQHWRQVLQKVLETSESLNHVILLEQAFSCEIVKTYRLIRSPPTSIAITNTEKAEPTRKHFCFEIKVNKSRVKNRRDIQHLVHPSRVSPNGTCFQSAENVKIENLCHRRIFQGNNKYFRIMRVFFQWQRTILLI